MSSGAADMTVGHRKGANECKGRLSAGGYHGPYYLPREFPASPWNPVFLYLSYCSPRGVH